LPHRSGIEDLKRRWAPIVAAACSATAIIDYFAQGSVKRVENDAEYNIGVITTSLDHHDILIYGAPLFSCEMWQSDSRVVTVGEHEACTTLLRVCDEHIVGREFHTSKRPILRV
jgi:hypothetical protein